MRIVVLLALLASPALAGDLPNPAFTPGEANPALTKDVICAKGFTTRNYRNVTAATKRKVYALYKVKNHQGYCAGKEGCEVDHLISLEIGGANTVKNLWPEPFSGTKWNAHVKDKLENALHRELCSGEYTLEEVQRSISEDWIAAYQLRFGDPK